MPTTTEVAPKSEWKTLNLSDLFRSGVIATVQIRRRRECSTCKERFTTFEIAELVLPRVIKRDGSREPFNEEKLRLGLQRALEKRPVSTESVEKAINQIKSSLRATGEREVESELVGNLIMNELKELDKVAYVRFASVYRSFEDIREFGLEIAKLGQVQDGESK